MIIRIKWLHVLKLFQKKLKQITYSIITSAEETDVLPLSTFRGCLLCRVGQSTTG